MSIVYQHRRLDTNEIFYVGIGKNEKRAYATSGRNSYWNNVVKKTGYVVEIVCRDITYEEACFLEIALIAKYGRSDLNEGSLTNMTDGGVGFPNLSPETKKLIYTPEWSKKRVANTDFKAFQSRRLANTDYVQRTKNTDFHSPEAREMRRQIYHRIKHKIHTPEAIAKMVANTDWDAKSKKMKKSVLQYSMEGEFIKEWSSALDVQDELGISQANISACCRKFKRKSTGGFKWEFKIS